MKKLTATLLFVAFLFPLCVFAADTLVADKFKKSFPKNNFESITPTTIKGLYEVYNGSQIYYYMPKDDVIFYGNLITKDGKNLTRDSNAKKLRKKWLKCLWTAL